jgi:hypothetical protein
MIQNNDLLSLIDGATIAACAPCGETPHERHQNTKITTNQQQK